jgi:hypothetical protein
VANMVVRMAPYNIQYMSINSHTVNYKHWYMLLATRTTTYLELATSIELLQAVDSFLSVDESGHTVTLLHNTRHQCQYTIHHVYTHESVQHAGILTHIHTCLSASVAVMRLAGLTVSILLMRLLASGVTVSHSGDG